MKNFKFDVGWLALAVFSLSLFTLEVIANARPVRTRSPLLLKSSHPIPGGYEVVERVPGDLRINLQIGIQHGRFDELERQLYEVSSPDHHQYGRHLSKEDVNLLVEPSVEAQRLVQEWLDDYNVENYAYSPTKDWLFIDCEISLAEELLGAQYYFYRHVVDGEIVIRTPSWSLPSHLHEHIEAVHPSDAFFGQNRQASSRIRPRSKVGPIGLGQNDIPTYDELVTIDRAEMGHMDIPDIKNMPEKPTVDQACNRLATSPLCLRTLYGTLGYKPQVPGKTRIGIVNYLDQVNNKSDIEIFLERYRPDAKGATLQIKTEIIAGGLDQQEPVTPAQGEHNIGLEGNLNAETVIGIAHPIPVTTYNVGGRGLFRPSIFSTENRNEPYLEWLQHMLDQTDLPQVISTSYADEEQTIPLWYAQRVCKGFAQLGARGVSVLFASGDDGVGSDDKCFSNDGTKKAMFLPTFPASCPWVTTVGGTRGWRPEVAGFDARRTFVAGGGFSNYFSRPHYQKRVVDDYVDGLDGMYDGLYNKTGRGYPDISARAYHYITVWNGTARIIDGTSAAAPAMAAIVALINDALAAEGRPSLGWLNPWIYSKGFQGFTDVKAGSNMGCNTAGFPARPGWDAATGFGTPWFPKLRQLAQERYEHSVRPWYLADWIS